MNEDNFATSTADEREANRREIARLTEEFLARGGEIEVIPPTRSRMEKKYGIEVVPC